MARLMPDPVIVVPGITATYLTDQYPISPENIWAVLHKDYARVQLHPDNRPDTSKWLELSEPAAVRPGQLYEVAYRELIEELRANLTTDPSEPVPVYPFGYDWRQPLDHIEESLADFVEEVIERTRLTRHYHADGYAAEPTVTLIGHSMGGLLIAGYLDRHGGRHRAGKVVTMAAPYFGSVEAITKVTTGIGDFGSDPGNSRERKAARLTPALYHLLPNFDHAVATGEGAERDIFKPEVWQSSVVETIADFIDQRGLPGEDTQARAGDLFNRLLAQANQHRDRLAAFRLEDAGLDVDDWLCVVGVGSQTRIGILVREQADGNKFEINSDLRIDLWGIDKDDDDNVVGRAEWYRSGDGTVPYRGALPSFVPIEKVVCITPDDFGFWEMQDKALAKLSGFHGILPNMNMLIRMVVRYLTNAPDHHDNTWGRRAPDLPLDAPWLPPLALREKDPH